MEKGKRKATDERPGNEAKKTRGNAQSASAVSDEGMPTFRGTDYLNDAGKSRGGEGVPGSVWVKLALGAGREIPLVEITDLPPNCTNVSRLLKYLRKECEETKPYLEKLSPPGRLVLCSPTEEEVESKLRGVVTRDAQGLEDTFIDPTTPLSEVPKFVVVVDTEPQSVAPEALEVVEYKPPPRNLCHSEGASWEYQPCDATTQDIAEAVLKHYQSWKAGMTDKQTHPMVFVDGPPGTGKSRMLDELVPTLVSHFGKSNTPETRELATILDESCVFKVTFENGSGAMVRDQSADIPPACEVGCRMLWQLVGEDTDWESFLENERHHLPPRKVIKKLHSQGHKAFVILCDSLQYLLHERGSKTSDLYKVLITLQDLVNQHSGVFVVVAGAYTSYAVDDALRGSPQRRKIVTPPSVDGRKVIDNPNNDPLLDILIDDMGGHGRALEALDVSLDASKNIEDIFRDVYGSLTDKYPNLTRSSGYGMGVRLVLSNKNVEREELLGGMGKTVDDLLQLGLFRMTDQGTLTCPYILLALLAPRMDRDFRCDIIQPLKRDGDGFTDPRTSWMSFEEFNVELRALRSAVASSDSTLWDIHAGAMMKALPPIAPRKLTKHRASVRYATPYDADVREIKCEDKNVDLTAMDAFILNAEGAPSGDAFGRIAPDVHEVHQYKKYSPSTPLTVDDLKKERAKAANEGDVFAMFTATNTGISEASLPARTILVDDRNYERYYGPFAGRAFRFQSKRGAPNVHSALRSHLVAVKGISAEVADAIITLRERGMTFDSPEGLRKALSEHLCRKHFQGLDLLRYNV